MTQPPAESRAARLIRWGAFVFGVVVLVVLVRHAGLRTLVDSIAGAGWVVLPVVALWGVVYACNARAWQLLVPHRPPAFTFRRAFLLSVHAFALNFATPFLAMGGEPFRVTGAARWLGTSRAVGSVVGFRFLHATAHLIVFLLAIIPTAILLPHTAPILGGLAVVAAILGLILSFLLSQHREGVFEKGVALLSRVRLLRPIAHRLERHRETLQELDRELTAIHREAPWHFQRALAIELLGRLLCTLEYALILWSLGVDQVLLRGFVIANASSLITNLLIFIPFEMGTKEGGSFAIFGLLGLEPALGMTAALLSRVRELSWMAIGLGCGLLLSRETPEAS